jgi:DNA/RNA endonuclease YhcR with UshA esterase domain
MIMMLTLLTYEPVGDINNHFQNSSMLERQERAALGLLVGVVITVIVAHLILGSLGKQPFASPFTNDSTDGELVIAAGTIDHLVITQNGGHMNVYTDNFTIFIPSQVVQELTLQKGDVISVYGTVQTYRGKKEILVSSAHDVSVAPAKPQ